MQTIPLELRRNWVKLQNTEQGCLLQAEAGEVVYYFYSVYPPPPEATGMVEDAVGGPSRLRGGSIWVRSKNWSRISYIPYNVDGDTVEVIVGSLPNLNTDDKTDVISAINEVNTLAKTKVDSDAIGDLSAPSINFTAQYIEASQP